MKKIYKCTECGKSFTLDDCELPEPRTINDGTKHERIVCDSCFEYLWDKTEIVNCFNCGCWFDSRDVLLHGEDIGSETFYPCPNCNHDIVDGKTKAEYIKEANLTKAEENPSFAVTFSYDDGDNATYLFPTEEKRIMFIDQRIRDLKEDGTYLGSASIHPDALVVITEDANREKHRMQIIKSNIYR